MTFDWNKYCQHTFSTQLMSSLVVCFILAVIAILVGKKVSKLKPEDKPPLIVSLFEVLVNIINNFVKGNIGKRWRSYAPYILTIALYLAFANLAGLIPIPLWVCLPEGTVTEAGWQLASLTAPTSCWNITLALALITGFLIHYTGIRSRGIWKYIKETYFAPLPFLFPVNLVGEITFPLSLSLRLFGNILSGSVLSILVYGLLKQALPWGAFGVLITPFMHAIFDVMFGIIQVLVFVLLTTIFISQKVDEKELEDEGPKKAIENVEEPVMA